jgi:cation transport ATPase
MGGTDPVAVRWLSRLRPLGEPALVVLTVGALAGGGIAWLVGWRDVADGCWIAGTVLAMAPALVWMLVALRRGRVGVDVIAVLSLVGTLLVHEYLAGALIAVMLTGGRALDAAAARRASHDLRALLERAPRFARRRAGTQVSVIPLLRDIDTIDGELRLLARAWRVGRHLTGGNRALCANRPVA